MAKNTIEFFDGKYSFLSNFYPSPIDFKKETWKTVEHLFQAAKTYDKSAQEEIRNAPTPGDAKFLGRRVALRPDWNDVKRKVMAKFVRLKFKQNSDIKEKLLRTGNALIIEGNTWHDNIWGVCICARCDKKEGQNLLGKILMEARTEITREKTGLLEPIKKIASEDSGYRLVEITIRGLYTEVTAFCTAAIELRKEFPAEEWSITNLLRIPEENNTTRVVFEIGRIKEDEE